MFHNNFNQMKLLLKYLDHKNNFLILGMDKKNAAKMGSVKEELLTLTKNAYVEYTENDINWGGYSQISTTLHMLEKSQQYPCDYIHFITGADVPLMNAEMFDIFFENNRGFQFIEYAKDNYEFAKYKCNYFHLFVENKAYRNSLSLKMLNHGFVRLQKLLSIERKHSRLYHGSAYFSITNELAKYIISKQEYIKKNFRFTLGADEVWLQTIVADSAYLNNVYKFEMDGANLRYIDWKRRVGSSPYTFVSEDYDDLKRIMNTKYIFARKFDENRDMDIISKIYSDLNKTKVKKSL